MKKHVATIMVFENKFGDWTGAMRDESTKEIIRIRYSNRSEAIDEIKKEVYNKFGDFNTASIKRKTNADYLANIYV